MSSEMQSWFRGVASPVLVAIFVGIGSSYFTTQSMVQAVAETVKRHEVQIQKLEEERRVVIQLQEQVKNLERTLERIEKKLDAK